MIAEELRDEYVVTKAAIANLATDPFNKSEIERNHYYYYRLSEFIDSTLWSIMLLVAASDGPINGDEARFINTVFGKSYDVFEYNTTWAAFAKRSSAKSNLGTLIDTSLRLGYRTTTDLRNYDPFKDPLIGILDRIAQGLIACDSFSDDLEAAKLAEFTVIAHKKAAKLRGPESSSVKPKSSSRQRATETKKSLTSNSEKENDLDRYAVRSDIDEAISDLHQLVGLSSVKSEVETLVNLAKIFALRRERNLPVPPFSFHLIFTGNPGTGKTTVARIIARIYGSLNLLSSGHLVEVDRSGLVANYVGQTASKTTKVLDSAIGGVLFIDEAYALTRGAENDFGSEAIEVILKRMEDGRSDLVVIAAGYDENMREFLGSNPGLKSRFPKIIDFPDYAPEEMAEIFERMATSSGYALAPAAETTLLTQMQEMWMNRSTEFANARDVRNLFEKSISAQANRLARASAIDDHILTTITDGDLVYSKENE